MHSQRFDLECSFQIREVVQNKLPLIKWKLHVQNLNVKKKGGEIESESSEEMERMQGRMCGREDSRS